MVVSDVLFRLGWNDRWTALFAPHHDAGLVPGRVVRVDRDRVAVATASGEIAGFARDLPAAGDWVGMAGDAVSVVLPRASMLVRQDAERPVAQVIAVNLDVAFVVAALDPEVNLRRLERTLAMVWESGAVPVVVLTKPDRCADLDGQLAAARGVAPGDEVLVVNGRTGEGVDALRAHLVGDRTAVFVGASGAGKSTLTNALLGADVLATGEVRGVDRKGRHTTSARHLAVVPGDGGGIVIDTPGLRSLGVWDIGDGAAAAFVDVDELAVGCRFRDCRHDAEPGCAVVGRVDAERLRNWRRLTEPLDPAEARRRARVVEKSLRRTAVKPKR